MHNNHNNKNGSYERNPERDWVVLLCVFFVLIVLVFAGSIYFYDGISSGSLFPDRASGASSEPTVDTAKLDALVGAYETRAHQFAALKQNDPQVVDPSL